MESSRQIDLFIVTVVEDYSISNAFVFTDKTKAERKVLTLAKRIFPDETFIELEDVYEFQCSEQWWDNDYRVRVEMMTAKEE